MDVGPTSPSAEPGQPELIYPSAVEFNLNKQISMLLHLEAVMRLDMGTTEVRASVCPATDCHTSSSNPLALLEKETWKEAPKIKL